MEALAEAFVFQTTFRHRGGYSSTTKRTSTLYLFYHGNNYLIHVMLYLHPPSKFKIYNMTNDNNRGRISRIHFQYKEKVTIFSLLFRLYIQQYDLFHLQIFIQMK